MSRFVLVLALMLIPGARAEDEETTTAGPDGSSDDGGPDSFIEIGDPEMETAPINQKSLGRRAEVDQDTQVAKNSCRESVRDGYISVPELNDCLRANGAAFTNVEWIEVQYGHTDYLTNICGAFGYGVYYHPEGGDMCHSSAAMYPSYCGQGWLGGRCSNGCGNTNYKGFVCTNQGAAASGDPHLVNIKGESFDVMQTGSMLLLEVPLGASESLKFAVQADIERLGLVACGPTFITKISMTGQWLDTPIAIRAGHLNRPSADWGSFKAFGIQLDKGSWLDHELFQSKENGKMTITKSERKFIMNVDALDISVSLPNRPRSFLDINIQGIGKLTDQVGGLLGIGDHSEVEQVPLECKKRDLKQTENEQWGAVASL